MRSASSAMSTVLAHAGSPEADVQKRVRVSSIRSVWRWDSGKSRSMSPMPPSTRTPNWTPSVLRPRLVVIWMTPFPALDP